MSSSLGSDFKCFQRCKPASVSLSYHHVFAQSMTRHILTTSNSCTERLNKQLSCPTGPSVKHMLKMCTMTSAGTQRHVYITLIVTSYDVICMQLLQRCVHQWCNMTHDQSVDKKHLQANQTSDPDLDCLKHGRDLATAVASCQCCKTS